VLDQTPFTPMDILRAVSPEGARTCMDHRAATMDNPALRSGSLKYKLLMGIGVAASLQSSTSTLMWTTRARQAGVSDAEIAEAILVSRLMKMAAVNHTAADALAWLQSR